jgi:hypothetical protein
VAVQEKHDLANLHALLPGIGYPLPALWPDAIDRLQVGGVVADYFQHFGTEMADQLFREHRPHSLDETAAEVSLNPLAGSRRGRLQNLGLELESVLLVPDPPTPVNHSPALMQGTEPSTVTWSRCPRIFTRSTANPLSSLKKVTRSTRPAISSVLVLSPGEEAPILIGV